MKILELCEVNWQMGLIADSHWSNLNDKSVENIQTEQKKGRMGNTGKKHKRYVGHSLKM